MPVKFNVLNNTPSDWVKAVAAFLLVLVSGVPATSTAAGWVTLVSAALLAGLAGLGLYHSSAEVPLPYAPRTSLPGLGEPIIPPGVNGIHTDGSGAVIPSPSNTDDNGIPPTSSVIG